MQEIDELKKQLEVKDATIKKMVEQKRLTDNHVNNLNTIIETLRGEIESMQTQLTSLYRHESIPFKIARKLKARYDAKYPIGSKERKDSYYRRMRFLHPIKYLRMISSEEGRNLIEGDYKIGDIYKTYGRLHFPVEEEPAVSIIIPVYNQIEYTYACLASILEHTSDVSYEIIIADDMSTDETVCLEKYVDGLQISRTGTNYGFLKNCNAASRLARGKYILFLNNDTTVTSGWLSSLVELIESDDTIGMVGSKLVYPDGRLQEAGGIIWSDASGWNYGRYDAPGKCEYNYVKDVDYISGAAIMLSRRLWQDIGGFDERYAPAYYEDVDLAFEVRKIGYRVVYQPMSVVVHYEGLSNGTDVTGSGLKRYQEENATKFGQKWADELVAQVPSSSDAETFCARDRSMGRKVILIIDHCVPMFDKDAGSKGVYQFIKMFIAKGFVVKFYADDMNYPEKYTSILQQLGVETLYETDILAWLEKNARHIHRVYLNRPDVAIKYIDALKTKYHLPVIYYGYDLHYLRITRQYELTGDESLRELATYYKSIEFIIMKKADVSYVPSQIEYDVIRSEDDSINVKTVTIFVFDKFDDENQVDKYDARISDETMVEGSTNHVGADRQSDKSMDDSTALRVANHQGRRDILFVGGFAHPPNVDAVKWFVADVWDEIRSRIDARFIVVGSNPTDEIMKLNDDTRDICIKGFVSDEELDALYKSVSMVAVPLRFGAGIKGKIIDALHAGKPIVTTSIGAEGIPDADSVMRIADSKEGLVREICELYQDEERQAQMSKDAYRYVREHHSIDAVWNLIKDDF